MNNENFENTINNSEESKKVVEYTEVTYSDLSKENTTSEVYKPKLEYEGLGGWLILVILGLFASAWRIVASLITVYYPIFSDGTVKDLANKANENYSSLWVPTLTTELIYNCILLVFVILTLICIFLKKKFVPKMMIGIYLFGLIFTVADYILVLNLPIIDGTNNNSITGLIGSIVSCSIWIPYFLKSVRVKNTFVN